jgi:hypothetical protein
MKLDSEVLTIPNQTRTASNGDLAEGQRAKIKSYPTQDSSQDVNKHI